MKILCNKYKTIITSLILVITSLIFIFSFLSLSSCRSADVDQDNSIIGLGRSGGIAAVNINLLGTEYTNSDKPSQVASINQKGAMIDNSVQHYNVLVSPSSFITAELAPATTLNTVASTSNNLKLKAAVSGNKLESGMKFRVLAYRKDNGNYQTYQDYIVGQSAQPMMLYGGETYDIIVYSYGVNTLPTISANEQTNISNAKINYDNDNRDLMYQKISGFTPDGNSASNTLNIKLRHKIPNLTVTLNSTSVISAVSNALIGNNYANAKLSLQSGGMTDWGSPNKVNVEFPSGSSNSLTSIPVFVNNDTNKGLFSADITMAGATKTIDLVDAFKITPEYKSNLTINLKKCGAYFGPNNTLWKDFMCQNLGATEGIDPFSPEAGNHGAKYQWGANAGETGRYVSQVDDQSHSGTISDWISTSKPENSWSDTSKTANDPCPSGYRVPTKAQWQAVINNNPNIERVGSWDENGNYTTALYFRSPSNIRTLMLPAGGYRNNKDGALGSRGEDGYYWSSSSGVWALYFMSRDVNVGQSTSSYGLSIRCIAE